MLPRNPVLSSSTPTSLANMAATQCVWQWEVGGEAVRDGGPHKYIYQKKKPSFGRMIFLY